MMNRLIPKIFLLTGIFFLVTTSWLVQSSISQYEYNPPVTTVSPQRCPVNGLVGYWRLDEVADGVTPDSSESNNAGKLKFWFRDKIGLLFGGPWSIKGMNGNGLEFKGRQWVSGGNNSCFATETFTISAWVWQERDDMEIPTILAKSSWPFDGWWLCSTTQGVRDIDVGIAWGNGVTHVKSGYRLPLREWHHIAVSMDNKRHEARFYIDGKPFGEKHKNVPNWLVNWNHDLFLGEYDGSGRWPWFGKLDDVRFYNLVISDEEAREAYMAHSKS